MAQFIKHERLRPHLDTLIKRVAAEGQDFRIYAETAPVTGRTDDLDEFKQIDELKTQGYKYLEVRVFQGKSPNYESHHFPFVETEVSSIVPQPIGSYAGGGLAGLGGDYVAAFHAELNSRLQGEENIRIKEKLADQKQQIEKLTSQRDSLQSELDRLPMMRVVGSGLAGTIQGLLASPAMKNTPLAGLLSPSEPAEQDGYDNETATGGAIGGYEEVVDDLSQEARRFAVEFQRRFVLADQQKVARIIEMLSEHPSLIPAVYGQIEATVKSKSQPTTSATI